MEHIATCNLICAQVSRIRAHTHITHPCPHTQRTSLVCVYDLNLCDIYQRLQIHAMFLEPLSQEYHLFLIWRWHSYYLKFPQLYSRPHISSPILLYYGEIISNTFSLFKNHTLPHANHIASYIHGQLLFNIQHWQRSVTWISKLYLTNTYPTMHFCSWIMNLVINKGQYTPPPLPLPSYLKFFPVVCFD